MVAASAGNHAQGVALAAQLLGHAGPRCSCRRLAPLPKVAATRGYGAEVRLVGDTLDETLAPPREFAERTGAVLVHPFDHADVIAGQGTVGLEIFEQVPGRAHGAGADRRRRAARPGSRRRVQGLAPDVRVIGVQAAGAAAWPPSLAAGGRWR